MRRFTWLCSLLFFGLIIPAWLVAQETPVSGEQAVEDLVAAEGNEMENDEYLQQLEQFRKHPINLNTADVDELKQLQLITDIQPGNLVAYRGLFGSLISIYELQAVPGWDIPTIRRLLPFITTESTNGSDETIYSALHKGEHSFLTRLSFQSEKPGNDLASEQYPGSPVRLFFRYRYVYKDKVRWGITGDKDAGEQFFKGAQRKGFDFYSFHLFIKNTGIIKSIAIGDYTVNLGQGLTHWQGLAFKKGAAILNAKHESASVKPYSSAGEYNFHRGAAITIRKGKMEGMLFISNRMIDANTGFDSTTNTTVFTSILTSGLHRTKNELSDRNTVRQLTAGMNLHVDGQFGKRSADRYHIGINAVAYQFSLPLKKRDEPYNLYAISGDRWRNMSIDYAYTFRNIHFFGELAVDVNFHKGYTVGVLMSVDSRVDMSVVYRNIDKAYQALYANAFTENTAPGNEKGLYAGITFRPAQGWRIDMYGDIYKIPWLTYTSDRPGGGHEYLVQCTYTPGRQVEMYTRYRVRRRGGEALFSEQGLNNESVQRNFRFNLQYKINSGIMIRSRTELVSCLYSGRELGFLGYFDIIYKPLMKKAGYVFRYGYFETDSYESRVYAYENDVAFSYSVPALSGKGKRAYLVYNYDVTKKLTAWLRAAFTVYGSGGNVVGNGGVKEGSVVWECRAQLRYIL